MNTVQLFFPKSPIFRLYYRYDTNIWGYGVICESINIGSNLLKNADGSAEILEKDGAKSTVI